MDCPFLCLPRLFIYFFGCYGYVFIYFFKMHYFFKCNSNGIIGIRNNNKCGRMKKEMNQEDEKNGVLWDSEVGIILYQSTPLIFFGEQEYILTFFRFLLGCLGGVEYNLKDEVVWSRHRGGFISLFRRGDEGEDDDGKGTNRCFGCKTKPFAVLSK